MRTKTMKLTIAVVAAAAAFSLVACEPDGSDSADGAAGQDATAAATATAGGKAGGSTGGTNSSGSTTGGSTGGGSTTGGSTTGGSTGGSTGGTGGGSTSGGSAGGGKLKQAAQQVKIGQSATVDYADKQANITTKLEVTVTGVEIGSIKDFQDAKAPSANAEGHTLVYVSYTIKNIGDASLSFTSPNSKFVVADPTGRNGIFLSPTGSTPLAKCPPPKFQGIKKGMEAKGCDVIGLAGTNNTPAQVGYTDLANPLELQASWTK